MECEEACDCRGESDLTIAATVSGLRSGRVGLHAAAQPGELASGGERRREMSGGEWWRVEVKRVEGVLAAAVLMLWPDVCSCLWVRVRPWEKG